VRREFGSEKTNHVRENRRRPFCCLDYVYCCNPELFSIITTMIPKCEKGGGEKC